MATTNELLAARTFLRRCFPRGGRVLCAVSGGMDSMCLLYFLDTWGRKNGFDIAAAHFNHQLRGTAADRDQAFVETWCQERKIPCFTGSGDTRALMRENGLSMEEAARTLRYAFLQETAGREGYEAIMTAHHADDNDPGDRHGGAYGDSQDSGEPVPALSAHFPVRVGGVCPLPRHPPCGG